MRTLGAIERRRAAAFAGRVVAPGTVSVHVRKGDKWVEVRALLDDIVLYQGSTFELLMPFLEGSLTAYQEKERDS